jgi:amiloride-sensitive sodium channel subunit beta
MKLFLAIVFCNLNPYNGVYARSYIQYVLEYKNISIQNYKSYYHYTEAASSQYKADIEEFYYESPPYSNIYELGEYLSSMLISCQYQGKNCDASNFYAFHDYEYGNCFRFNGLDASTDYLDYNYTKASSLYQSRKPGSQNGLILELYAGDPNTQSQFITSTGFKVLVHNQTVIPFPAEEGILASVGQQTNVAITRRFVNRLSQPYSDCIDTLTQESSNANPILQIMYEQLQSSKIMTYQQSYCLKVCYFQYSTDLCGCFDFSLYFLNVTTSQQPCETVESVNCLNEAETKFYSSEVSDKCLAECPTECSTVDYDITVSVANYPSVWYAQLLNESNRTFELNTKIYNTDNISLALIQSTTLLLNIYYDSLYFDVITETPAITFDKLLAGTK